MIHRVRSARHSRTKCRSFVPKPHGNVQDESCPEGQFTLILCSCMSVCVCMWVVLTVNILLFRIWFCGTWNRLQGDDRRRSLQETAAFLGASYTQRLKSAEHTEPHRNRASPQISLYRLQDRAGCANRTSERRKGQQ